MSMLVRVTCGGVIIGTAEFDPPVGVAHTTLTPTPAYLVAIAAAQRLGRCFARRQYWCPADGDFADHAATLWEGPRLALEDLTGRELGVPNVVVLEGMPGADGGTTIRVVADFRADSARIVAPITQPDVGGEHRTRPAA
jgi:hypothetical protein